MLKWGVEHHSPFFIGTSQAALRYVSLRLYRGLSSKIASLERIGLGADESRSRSPLAPNFCLIIIASTFMSRKKSKYYHFITAINTGGY
jgi:hypothetical protein